MIMMVSTNTFSARDPDYKASRKRNRSARPRALSRARRPSNRSQHGHNPCLLVLDGWRLDTLEE